MSTMKKFIAFGFGALTALALGVLWKGPQIVEAAGHIGFRNVLPYLRTQKVTYQVWVPDTGANSTDTTVGLNGIIAKEAWAAGTVTLANTSTIEVPPYPCKLMIYPKDVSNNNVLACTGDMIICGYNQFGQPVGDRAVSGGTGSGCETISTNFVEGTPVKSERVYERVTSFTVSSCTGGGSPTDDFLQIACAPDIGLPFPIENYQGVISVCLAENDSGAAENLQCFGGQSADGVADSEDVDLGDDSITLYDNAVNTTGIGEDDIGSDFTLGDGDLVHIRVRPPAGL